MVALIETILVIALAWFAASFFWLLFLGDIPLPETPTNTLAAKTQTARSLNDNFDILTQFDPFNRTINSAPVAVEQTLAPETSLDLKLFGVRHSLDNKTNGSAIIRTPDQKEYVFTINDEIIDGVELTAIYATHVEIMRAGLRESLYLDGVDPETVQSSLRSAASHSSQNTLPTLAKENGGSVRKSQIEAFVASARMQPRKRGRLIDGWIISADSNQVDLLALGLKPNDVFLSINNTPFRTLETMAELVEEIGNSSNFKIRIERDGKLKELTFDYLATQ